MSTSAELDRWPTYSKYEVLPVPSDPEGHVALVTAIAFGRSGEFLAIASVRYAGPSVIGLIQVYSMEDSLSIKRAVNIPAHPTVLVWHQNVLIIGDRTGDVTLIDCDSLDHESVNEQENWAGGEIRAIAVAGNRVALGTPLGVYIAKLRARSWYRAGSWYDRTVVHYPSSAPSSASEKHCPVAVDFTSDCKVLVVTYERHGIVLFDPTTGNAIHHIQPASDIIGSSALSPRDAVLAATNMNGGIDIYTLEGERSRHDYTLPLQRRGLNRAIPIIFIHEGAGMLVGSTHGVAQVLTSRGSLMQFFTVDPEQYLVQEIAYVVSGRRHYMAFGTADSSGRNVVAIYRSQEQSTVARVTRRKIKESVIGGCSVAAVLLLAVIVCLGTLSLWQSLPGSAVSETSSLRPAILDQDDGFDGDADFFEDISSPASEQGSLMGVNGYYIGVEPYEGSLIGRWLSTVDDMLWRMGIWY